MRMRSLTLLGAVLVALPVLAAAAENDFKAMFVRHWQTAKEFTLAVAEAMPAEDYDFKPSKDEMSFAQLMVHIAAQNSDSCATATGTKVPPSMPSSSGPVPAMDKQAAIQLLTVSFDTCAKELDAVTPEQWNREVYKFQGRPVLASEAMWYTFTHMAHHRGQAEVYLRAKNIKPPAWRF